MGDYITYKFPKSSVEHISFGLRIEELALEDVNLDSLIDVVIIVSDFTGIGQTPFNRNMYMYIYTGR